MKRSEHLVLIPCAAIVLLSIGLTSCGPRIDRTAAKSVADSFISDLVDQRVDEALSKMEPELVQMMGHDKAVESIQKVFEYCGRPLGSKFWRDEAGFYVYFDGRKKAMRKFYYATPTTQRPNGGCYFTAMVVPAAQDDYKVVAFTAGKL
jgi:hypothetical protein